MTLTRFILLAGAVLVVGFLWSLGRPLPGLYPDATLPARPNELWEITTP